MKFSEIPYVRPDFAAAKAFYAAAAGRLRAASGFAAAEAVFLEAEEFAAGLETALAVAEIRRDMDTRDPFYAGESAFIDRLRPELREYEQLFEDALQATPFRAEFEAKYGRMMFTGAEISRRAFTGALVAPMQREKRPVLGVLQAAGLRPDPLRGRGLHPLAADALQAGPPAASAARRPGPRRTRGTPPRLEARLALCRACGAARRDGPDPGPCGLHPAGLRPDGPLLLRPRRGRALPAPPCWSTSSPRRRGPAPSRRSGWASACPSATPTATCGSPAATRGRPARAGRFSPRPAASTMS